MAEATLKAAFGCCCVAPFFCGLIVLLFVWLRAMVGQYRFIHYECPALFSSWGNANGYRIQQCERSVRRGPFFFDRRGIVIYRFSVRDANGRERTGWASIRGWPPWRTKREVVVRWDDVDDEIHWEVPATDPPGPLRPTGPNPPPTSRSDPLWDSELDDPG